MTEAEEKTFVPTPAAEYPIVKAQELELPSGARVEVKQPSVYILIRTSRIPASVMSIFTKSANGEEITTEDTFAALDFLVAASFVSPQVSLTRKKDHVLLDDICDDDRNAVIESLGLKV